MQLRSGRVINYTNKVKTIDTTDKVKKNKLYDYITNNIRMMNESIRKCKTTLESVIQIQVLLNFIYNHLVTIKKVCSKLSIDYLKQRIINYKNTKLIAKNSDQEYIYKEFHKTCDKVLKKID